MARTRVQKLERRLIVFAALAVVFGGILLFRPSTVTGISSDSLALLVPEFEKEAVRKIELSQQAPGAEAAKVVRLEKTSQGWVLPERFGYAALPGSVARLLDDVADARERSSVTRRAETFDKYRGGDGWVDLKMTDGAGKALVDMKIGRADRTDVFVRLKRGDGEEVVRAINLRPRLASVDSKSWIETQLWSSGLKASSVVRIDMISKDAPQPISVVKRGASSEKLGVTVPDKDPEVVEKVWWMLSPQTTDADTFEVQDVARSVTGMLVEDIVARAQSAADDAKYGFDKPEVRVKVWTEDGDVVTSHEMVVGAQNEARDAWFVRRMDAPWVYEVATGKNINALRADHTKLVAKPGAKPEK